MATDAGFIPEPPFLKPRTSFPTSNFAIKAAFLIFSVVLLSFYPSRAPDFLGESFLNQGWELLHLLLVGIAVSYGLFSRRNADTDSEKAASTTAATVVNKSEASLSYLSRMNLRVATVFEEDDEDVERDAVLNETRMWSSQYSRVEPTVVVAQKRSQDAKPLCLPVRSLRPQAREPPRADPTSRGKAVDEISASGAARQLLGRMDGMERNGKLKNVQPANVKLGKEEEPTAVVLPSPIPWRSRSGRLEPNVKQGTSTPPPSPRPTKSASPLSTDVDPGVSRTPSFRSTSARKLPPPPPPPPRFSSPSLSVEVGTKTVEDVPKRRSVRRTPAVPPPPPPPPPPRMASSRSHRIHNRSNDQQLRKSFTDELKEASTSGGREHAPNAASWAEAPEVAREQPPPPPVEPEASSQKPPSRSGKKNRKKKTPRRFIIESDESDESSESSTTDGADHGGASSSATDAEADANEVDKKADEFIAKFREQIRLQRIESIKKSAQQRQRAGQSNT